MSTDPSGTSLLVDWSLLENNKIIQQCKQSLQTNGVMTISNFVTLTGITALKSEIISCPYNESTQHYTSYQDQGDLARYPSAHPRNYKVHSSASFVGRKSLHRTNDRRCIALYDDERLSTFLSNVASRKMHQSKDENGSVYSYRIESHHNPPWHFDESHYTAIIYLQNSEGGGAFECVPWCRKTKSVDDQEGHDVIRKVVMGEQNSNTKEAEIQRIHPEQGMLLFFSGVHTFHRAAKVTGLTARIGLVFTYSEDEDFCNSEDVRESNEWDPADSTKLICKGTD
mmetsp:Transcript_38255/g.81659  ORF Transcript_38255/g.81659 Transcript_38255/m.81659 type:complete len:283 (-) Transcript_38255:110-958(-)